MVETIKRYRTWILLGLVILATIVGFVLYAVVFENSIVDNSAIVCADVKGEGIDEIPFGITLSVTDKSYAISSGSCQYVPSGYFTATADILPKSSYISNELRLGYLQPGKQTDIVFEVQFLHPVSWNPKLFLAANRSQDLKDWCLAAWYPSRYFAELEYLPTGEAVTLADLRMSQKLAMGPVGAWTTKSYWSPADEANVLFYWPSNALTKCQGYMGE